MKLIFPVHQGCTDFLGQRAKFANGQCVEGRNNNNNNNNNNNTFVERHSAVASQTLAEQPNR